MSEPDSTARKGKIARCPLSIREEVNRRLLDGQPASKILPWLNSQEAVLRVLDEYFAEEPVTAQNLSEWRLGGYQDFLRHRSQLEKTAALARKAHDLAAAAGGDLGAGAIALLAGEILEAVESPDPDTLAALADSAVKIRASELDARRVGQRDRVLSQRDRALDLSERQIQLRTCEKFVEWYADQRARDIAESSSPREVKMDQLRLLIFGAPPSSSEGAS